MGLQMSWDETRKKINAFYNDNLGRLRTVYPFLNIENPNDGRVPRIRISYKNILCIITYGEYKNDSRANSYSMNWYRDDRLVRDYPEETSADRKTIELGMMGVAGILFAPLAPVQQARRPPPAYREEWGTDFFRND